MARIRNIKPQFFKDPKIGRLTAEARLLYIGLWTECDDCGNCPGDPMYLKGALFPYDSWNIPGMVLELSGLGRIEAYEVSGETYFHLPKFAAHQSIRKDKKHFEYPKKSDGCEVVLEDSGKIPGIVREPSGEGRREKGEEKRKKEEVSSPPAPKYDWSGMLESYNRIAKGRADLAAARSWTSKRKKAAQLRLKGSDAEEGWDEFIGALEVSDFSWWKSTTPGLDWFLKSENWAKTTEGNYTSRDARPAPLKDYVNMFPTPSKPPPVVDLFPDDEPF